MRRWSSDVPRGKMTAFPTSVDVMRPDLPARGRPASSGKVAPTGNAGWGPASLPACRARLRSMGAANVAKVPNVAPRGLAHARAGEILRLRASRSAQDDNLGGAAGAALGGGLGDAPRSALGDGLEGVACQVEAACRFGAASRVRTVNQSHANGCSGVTYQAHVTNQLHAVGLRGSAGQSCAAYRAQMVGRARAGRISRAMPQRAAALGALRSMAVADAPQCVAVMGTCGERVARNCLSLSFLGSGVAGWGRGSFSRRGTSARKEATVGGHYA